MKFLTTILLNLAIACILVNSGLQLAALFELNSLKDETTELSQTKRILLSAVILGFVSGALLSTALILLYMYSNSTSVTPYMMLLLAGLCLLAGGVLGGTVAFRLQCQRGTQDSPKDKAWQYCSYSSMIGVIGTLVLLFLEGFDRRSQIKQQVIKVLSEPVETVSRGTSTTGTGTYTDVRRVANMCGGGHDDDE